RVHDVTAPRPQGHMRNALAVGEAENVPRAVAGAGGVDRDRAAGECLLIAVAREADAPGRIRRLDQPRAIDAPFGASSPPVRGAGKPALRPLRGGDEPRFGPILRLGPHHAPGDGPRTPVRGV